MLKECYRQGAKRIYQGVAGYMKELTKLATKLLRKRMLDTSRVNWKSQFVKIRDIKNLRQDIEDNPIIKNQRANLGCLLVCTFGDYLALILVAVHTMNNLDRGNKPEDEGFDGEP